MASVSGARGDIQWLDVCRHRMRGVRAPYLVVIQHHLVTGPTRLAAPLIPAMNRPATLLAPHIRVGGMPFLAVLLALASVQLRQVGEVGGSARAEADAILDALDVIFRGYPVGLPI